MLPSAHITASASEKSSFAAQWLAYMLPYRRFADILANACARLGADADRYSFIVTDFHHLLLAGLPAHYVDGSHLQVFFADIFDRIACFHMCGLCVWSHMTTGQDGFRNACS
jgi:hypothetical protein